MKQKIIFIGILLYISFNIFCKDYNIYDTEIIKTFNVGEDISEYGLNLYSSPSEPIGPSSVAFDTDNNIYILDFANRKIIKYNPNFEFISELKNEKTLYSQLSIDNNGFIYIYTPTDMITIYSKDYTKVLSTISFHGTPFKNNIIDQSFVYLDNKVYFRTSDTNDLYYIENPGTDYKENNKNIKKSESNILKDGDKIINRNISDVVNQTETEFEFKYKKRIEKILRRSGRAAFVSNDSFGNTYWKSSGLISVINKDGDFIDIFILKDKNIRTWPGIHPSGDIYYVSHDEKHVYIHRLKRKW